MVYIYLITAIICEVIGTSSLQASQQFSRLIPSLITVVGYGGSFFFLSMTLKTMPVAIAYALWSGLGIILITMIGTFVFGQKPDAPALLGMFFIITGVVVMNVFSKTVTH